ncbi:type II toxin-antitoxin system HicA family toxin [Castellaniella sp. S9]|uniref:type II toxin-antitoxin system HicA family toxin n=1 Tax=Castellaniella sp. S9 TaxID=2993652 RepID=UPI003FA4B7A8
MNGYYEKVKAVLEQHGFSFIRQKGSHQMWGRGRVRVTVSTNCVSRHTANTIMKQAGIEQKF